MSFHASFIATQARQRGGIEFSSTSVVSFHASFIATQARQRGGNEFLGPSVSREGENSKRRKALSYKDTSVTKIWCG